MSFNYWLLLNVLATMGVLNNTVQRHTLKTEAASESGGVNKVLLQGFIINLKFKDWIQVSQQEKWTMISL